MIARQDVFFVSIRVEWKYRENKHVYVKNAICLLQTLYIIYNLLNNTNAKLMKRLSTTLK